MGPLNPLALDFLLVRASEPGPLRGSVSVC